MLLESARTIIVWFSVHNRVNPGDLLAKLKIRNDNGVRNATILVLGRCSHDFLSRYTVCIPSSLDIYTFIRRFRKSHDPELNIRRMIIDGAVYHTLSSDIPLCYILKEWQRKARISARNNAIVDCLRSRMPLDIIHHRIIPLVDNPQISKESG